MSRLKKNILYIIVAIQITTITLIYIPVLSAENNKDKPIIKSKKVLILISSDYGMPWYSIASKSIYSAFENTQNIEKINTHTEYAGIDNNYSPEYMLKLRSLYKHKFAGQKFDLIISESDTSTEFLIRYGSELFPGVPIVFISETEQIEKIKLNPNMTGIIETVKIKDTLDLSLKLHPGTQNIAVISGASGYDHFYEAKARKVFKDYDKRLKFIYLTGLSMDELFIRLNQLPEHTIIFFIIMMADGTGKHVIPREVVSKISMNSNKPLYGLWDTFLGTGIVGGYLSSAEIAGSKTAKLGLRILNGEKPRNIPVVRGFFAYMFDWRQLKKWGIRKSDLPVGSIIRYEEFSFLEIYKFHIIAYALLVITGVFGFIKYRTIAYERKLKEQEKIQKLLEEKVKKRTSALQIANTELERLSHIDGLTSLNNRRYFDKLLEHEWKRNSRNRSPISLVMCDIDYFKKYNDTYGHLAGDDCLKKVAQVFQNKTRRPSDIAARYGGEEFALILPDTNKDGALMVAMEIKNAIEQLGISYSTSSVKPVITMSFGVATMIPDQSYKPATLIHLADRALYISKNNGRNQVYWEKN